MCVCFAPTGYSVFVVGVADVDMTELRLIGSKPSERHVFVVDDYDAFAKIQDNLITFICETATSSKTDINTSRNTIVVEYVCITVGKSLDLD